MAGGGGRCCAPPSPCFLHLLKISLGNPYMKILVLTTLFAGDGPKEILNLEVYCTFDFFKAFVESSFCRNIAELVRSVRIP